MTLLTLDCFDALLFSSAPREGQMFMKILSCVGAFFIVFFPSAILLESGGSGPREAGTLGLIAAVVTWIVFPSKKKS